MNYSENEMYNNMLIIDKYRTYRYAGRYINVTFNFSPFFQSWI